MTLNETFQEYEIITDEPGSDFIIEYLPTGNRIRVTDGSVDVDNHFEVAGSQVVGARETAIGSLTDNTGGTTDGTLAAVSGSGADAAINNNFADLNAKLDAILAALGASSGHGLTGD